jgi:hypothetical protein
MWTVLVITITASAITLKSMRSLSKNKLPDKNKREQITYTNYIVSEAEYLPHIISAILKQLHLIQDEVTIEIVFMPKQVEFLLHIPSSVILPEDLMSKLIQINPIWSTQYNAELVIDDTESIRNTEIIAHQIIVKSKTPHVIFLTTRGVKRTPHHYMVSGIDTYKWDQFINRKSDSTPDLITHDRIYTLIQEKLMSY